MESTDLRIFVEVARSGSMNRAADKLHTVQSNVTRHVRQLESELGVELFERHSRGVELTEPGRRLLPYAEGVAHTLEDAERAVRDDGEPVGPLLIGSLETTAALRLPPVLASYTLAYPGVDLTLATNTTAGLVTQVLAHELQGAFVCGPIVHPDLEELNVFDEHLVVVTSPRTQDLEQLGGGPGHEVPSEEARVKTVFIRRRDRFLSSALAAFVEAAQAHYAAGTGDGASPAARQARPPVAVSA